jgi:hypothetical protein
MSLYYEHGSRKYDPVTNEFKLGQEHTLFRKVQPNVKSVFIKEHYTKDSSIISTVVPLICIAILITVAVQRSVA